MGATYHLWNADEVESLMKQRYPQYWDMYCNVRYPIMRADIGRIAILHTYGGLYADLDVHPNRGFYEQVKFAVARCPRQQKKKSGKVKAVRLPAKKTRTCRASTFLDMEVIVGSAGNAVFLAWLEYIREQIAEKPYKNKKNIFYKWRMRYVFHTTGPRGMTRFLNQRANAAYKRDMTFLECNHFKDAETLTAHEKRKFDVISYQSQSYFTTKHSMGPRSCHHCQRLYAWA